MWSRLKAGEKQGRSKHQKQMWQLWSFPNPKIQSVIQSRVRKVINRQRQVQKQEQSNSRVADLRVQVSRDREVSQRRIRSRSTKGVIHSRRQSRERLINKSKTDKANSTIQKSAGQKLTKQAISETEDRVNRVIYRELVQEIKEESLSNVECRQSGSVGNPRPAGKGTGETDQTDETWSWAECRLNGLNTFNLWTQLLI